MDAFGIAEFADPTLQESNAFLGIQLDFNADGMIAKRTVKHSVQLGFLDLNDLLSSFLALAHAN